MGKLELLVGNVGSGKSTYCNLAAAEGKIILNDDAIVTALHGGNYKLYSKDLKPLYKSVENQVVQTALILGRTVVVDRPNYSRLMRKRYIALAKSLDLPVDLIMFKREALEVHARRRYESDNRGSSYECWLKVAQEHQRLYEEPVRESEHFDNMLAWDFSTRSLMEISNEKNEYP